MGAVITGETYLQLFGQTIKAGKMYMNAYAPLAVIYGPIGPTVQYASVFGTGGAFNFLETGDAFNIIEYFREKFGGYENFPKQSTYDMWDSDGNPTQQASDAFFAFGYEYDAQTNRAKFYGGLYLIRQQTQQGYAYARISYDGYEIGTIPRDIDTKLAQVYFFGIQQDYIPDGTALSSAWSATGLRSFMNGSMFDCIGNNIKFFDPPSGYDAISLSYNYPVFLGSPYDDGNLYNFPFNAADPINADYTTAFYRVWNGSTMTGLQETRDIPEKLLEKKDPDDIHYNSDPAPVGLGGGGQYLFDPDDLDGSLDFDPDNGAVESGFAHLYIPTIQELKDFASYLWSSDFYNNMLKVLNDPMDAVINLMRVPIDLSAYRGTATHCLCGNVDTGVTMYPLNKSFLTINMGSLALVETWQSALDYSPYTSIRCYLPFIGYVTLNPNDLYQSIQQGYTHIKLTYRVNCFTGECVAALDMTKRTGKGKQYRYLIGQFAGNLGFNIPVTASNYSQFFSNLFNAGIQTAGAIASGGATAGINAAASVTGALATAGAGGNPEIQRSGNFSGGSSPLQYYVPFIVFEVPIQCMDVDGYSHSQGLPASCYRQIKAAGDGEFIRCEAVVMSGFSGTSDEARELETILKGGIYYAVEN